MVESWRETMQRLQGAQKGHARGAPAYSVYVNRRLGRLLAAVAYRAGLTPNQVSVVSGLFTFSGILLLALAIPAPWVGFVVAALLALGYAWDSADGQVARLRGGGSLSGEWLDHFLDAMKVASLHIAVLIGLYRLDALRGWVLLLPLLYAIVANVTFFGMILNDLLKGARGVKSTHTRGGGTAARSLILLPTDYGVLCLAFVLWGWPFAFLWVYALLLAANSAFLIAAAIRWFREMKSIDRLAAADG